MVVEEVGKAEEAIRENAKKEIVKKTIQFDTSFEDVIKYQSEGYELVFSWEKPIVLTSEQFSKLKSVNKDKYYQAKFASEGQDLVQTSMDSQLGYKKTYSVRPGSPTEKLTVLDKEPDMEYRWEIPDRVTSKEAQGWVIDEGKARKQINNDNGSNIKRIGSGNREELVLMKIPKTVVEEKEKKNRERYQKTKDYTLESFERLAHEAGSNVL